MKGWSAIILAASRGPQDPMAVAYGTHHKCLIEVGGFPMLARVVSALDDLPITVVIEPYVALPLDNVKRLAPKATAATSAKLAVLNVNSFPILITTGDHALLTSEIVEYVLSHSMQCNADVTVGLASADVILAAYPDTKRTFFKLGQDRVSGCNLFTVHNAKALGLFETWEKVERYRKKPWRLVAEFGIWPLVQLLTGQLTLTKGFDLVSQKTGATIKPLMLPFAEAAIDVDKPSDKELAERIVAQRSAPT